MLSPEIPHSDLSSSDIIKYCSAPNRQIISKNPIGNHVVKISDQAAVKYGDVTYEEARNQVVAFDLLCKATVRIPRVYRYFQEVGPPGYPPEGYLMMEYIDGKSLSSIEGPHQIAQIAEIVSSFSSIHGQIPGPFETGVARGILWSETGEPCFTTTQEMERWLNYRLPDGPILALKIFPLVICHLDIAPRNLLYLPDGSVCLIDWATAGFYPRFFEVCVLNINNNGQNGRFEELLL